MKTAFVRPGSPVGGPSPRLPRRPRWPIDADGRIGGVVSGAEEGRVRGRDVGRGAGGRGLTWLPLLLAVAAAGSTAAGARLAFKDSYLTLNCEEGKGYSCDELGRWRGEMGGDATLSVRGCPLRERLACLPNANKVKYLKLADTRGLTPDSLFGLDAVTRLEIEEDRNLTWISYAALSRLSSLHTLEIRDGAVTSLAGAGADEGAETLRLRRLEVSNCKLSALPAAALRRMPALTDLELWEDNIELIHEDALRGACSELKVLSLNNNWVRQLPARLLLECAALEELHLANNRLVTLNDIAPAIAAAESLQKLDLSGNRLEELRLGELSALRRLTHLDVSNNRLRALHALNASTLPLNLSWLDLSYNNLVTLDQRLEGLPQLQVLNLSDNKLVKLDAVAFKLLRFRLTNLVLSGNELRMCEAGSPSSEQSPLSKLSALRELELAYNRVTVVCNDWRKLPHLTHIDLSNNNISRLQPNDLAWMSPATVDLTDNAITAVKSHELDAPHPWPTLATFKLEDNPLACYCELYSFVRAYGDRNPADSVLDYDELTCAFPPTLAGHALAALATCATCRLPCATCASRCACAVDVAAGVYELRCPAPPAPRDYPSTDLPIRLALANRTDDVSNLPQEVKYLDLRNLSLTRAPHIDAAGVEVDLRDNLLTAVPRKLLGAVRALRLAGNPFFCACGEAEPEGLRGYDKRVLDLTNVTCAADDGGRCGVSDTLVLATSLSACALVLTVCGVLSCVGRVHSRVWAAVKGRKRLAYDVFLSFAEEEAGWVWAAVVPALGGRRVCVPARDWRPGAFVAEEGARSVREARFTVAVLSPAWARCRWRREELAAALALRRAVVLLRDDTGVPPPAPPPGPRALPAIPEYGTGCGESSAGEPNIPEGTKRRLVS